MGHLSKSEHICNEKPLSNDNIKLNNDNNINNLTTMPATKSICTELKNGTIPPIIKDDYNNNILPTGNFTNEEDETTGGEYDSTLKTLEFQADHRNKTDLNIYTDDFKGDSVFGIKFKAPLKWDKIIQIGFLHLYALYLVFWEMPYYLSFVPGLFNWQTLVWGFVTGGLAGFGVTGGAHRLWTHKSYKANVPLRTILMLCFSMSGQNTMFDWVRDHRVHHKYSETDADPHNAARGFFFAHVGWLMMLKHPQVIIRGRQIDMSDVLSDPVVQFHQKYFIPLKLVMTFLIPTMVPVIFWNERFYVAFISQCILRYCISLNFTWSVNSAAHIWGYRPYDRKISPSENRLVSFVAMGEGWHNYHHTFPWDYKTAELGQYGLNLTTMYLDMFSKFGWAWDMKQPSNDLIRKTIERSGDGTHPKLGHHNHPQEVPMPEENEDKKAN